jgi:hypothetical protein
MDRRLSRFNDPIFEVGFKTLNELINAHPNKSLDASGGGAFLN